MPDYTIPLNLANPQNPIDRELAHIITHLQSEGITLSAPTILTGPLRLRVTASGVPSQKVRDHFGLT